MRDDLIKDLLPSHGEAIDPQELARRDMRKKLPKRFYKEARAKLVDGAYVLTLDGKPARTPAGQSLAVASKIVAEALAAEWDAQTEFIEPGSMPLTRIINSAVDGVAKEVEAVRAEIVKYAGSDLMCYRADSPSNLVAEQAAAWDPVLGWVKLHLGARFVLAEGVMFVEQPAESIAAIADHVAQAEAPLRLAALHVMTTLMGSTLLALAVAHQHLSPKEAWDAAHLDEDFQARNWGMDADAMARRERRWVDMQAAALIALG